LLQYGGELATISDSATNEFIVSTLNGLWWHNNGIWIGLNDRHREQNWHWDNGQSVLVDIFHRSCYNHSFVHRFLYNRTVEGSTTTQHNI